MGKKHHPRRGSLAYSPRKRARRETPKVSSWPEINEPNPRIQGFAGYKAGMTHAMVIDTRKESTTSGQEICVPVTVLEVPPMKVFGIRVYGLSANGLVTLSEVSSPDIDKYLERVYPIPKKKHGGIKEEDKKNIEDVRLIVHTQPKLVTGVPKKKPEIMELRVGGATIEKRLDYAYSVLGKEIKITDFTKEGSLVDVIAVTKGKGFEGAIKRWGVKLLFHKNSKHRRMIGTLGPHFPSYVRPTVPQAGQFGYHQRTEYNKRILKIGDKGEEITPSGGFLHYGIIRNSYVLIEGSIPGCAKRLVRLRDPARAFGMIEKPELTYVSTSSKQGA